MNDDNEVFALEAMKIMNMFFFSPTHFLMLHLNVLGFYSQYGSNHYWMSYFYPRMTKLWIGCCKYVLLFPRLKECLSNSFNSIRITLFLLFKRQLVCTKIKREPPKLFSFFIKPCLSLKIQTTTILRKLLKNIETYFAGKNIFNLE